MFTQKRGEALQGGVMRILIIEDSAEDAKLEVRALRMSGLEFEWRMVSSFEELERALGSGEWDAVISDVGLPGLSVGVALPLIRSYDPELPVVIVSGTIGEASAVAAMKAGVQDYVLKGDGLARLAPALEREVEDAGHRRRLRRERRLRRSSERELRRLAAIVESSAEAIFSIANDGTVESWNRGAEKVFGHPEAGMIGAPCQVLVPGDRLAEFDEWLAHIGEGESVEHQESQWQRRDGSLIHVSVTMSPILGEDEEMVIGASVIVRDITYRLEAESKLRFLADHDVLTNLYNRRRFERELEREIKLVHRFGGEGAVMVLDIDNFKAINDSFGHRSGDEVISRVAQIIRDSVREVDIVARLGGDEFAIYIPDGSAAEVAARLISAVNGTVMLFGDRSVRASVSIGVAPVDGQLVSDEELMIRADLAMYEAKAAGRDNFAIYQTESREAERATEGLRLSERIRAALNEDRLRVFAQPILDRRQNRVSQYELLIRMDGADGAMVHPSDFLPTAERFGLTSDIDRWMISRAIGLLSDPLLLRSEDCLQVNLSSRSMVDPGLCDLIEHDLAAHGVNPWRLILEVTETSVIDNMEQARRLATRLTSFGCRFALDDFGAGFGSFYYLKHLPFEFLKIDGGFIRQLPANRADQHMVEAIINLAHRLGKRTIAECVEDNETIDLLCGFGIDYIQGYHIGHPHPAEEMSLLPRGGSGQAG